mmetsp:Transcript_39081/g.95577  ORF Transcript_39081/g.95577 Transcript_39081/m.95577 type:complete len:193 (-) Transcript_39081:146-724(-)
MDSLVSLIGDGFVMSAADTASARSVLVMKDDLDKIVHLDTRKLLSVSGEWGDAVQFTEFVQANVQLYQLRTGITLSTKGVAGFTRNELAKAIRKSPVAVNMLLAGYDDQAGPSLYYLDYLGTCHPMDYTAQGYASFFVLSTLDRHWHKGMTVDEATDLMRKCIAEIKVRFTINQPKFIVKVVDKDGVRTVDL